MIAFNSLLAILQARWQLAVACSLLVTALLLLSFRPKPQLYTTVGNVEVGQVPLPSTRELEEERYFGWVTSEYIAIGLRDWANGADFIDQLRWRLWVNGTRLSRNELDASFRADVVSTRVGLIALHEDKAISESIVAAAVETFMLHQSADIPQNKTTTVVVTPFDVEFLAEEPRVTLGQRIALPARVLIGLSSGILLVLLGELRFARIYSRNTIETLNLQVLGEIPRQ